MSSATGSATAALAAPTRDAASPDAKLPAKLPAKLERRGGLSIKGGSPPRCRARLNRSSGGHSAFHSARPPILSLDVRCFSANARIRSRQGAAARR